MVPPPAHSGERMLPARARPVPFCRQGFLPPPLTSPFVLVATVPARRAASWLRTASCRRCSRTGPATTALGPVAAGHALALEHTAGERAVSDRAAVAEVLVRAVRAREAAEAVALDDARRAAPLAHAGDGHALAHLEHVGDLDLAPHRGRLAVAQAELAQRREGAGPRLGELPGERLREALRLGGREADLRSDVAVTLGAAHGDHRTRPRLDDGHRHEPALPRVDLRHAELPSDEAADHDCCPSPALTPAYWSLISTSTPAARSSLPRASIVCCVGSRMSSRRLWVRISNCSRDFLSTCGERFTVKRSMWVGSGMGPATRPPVRRTVSTISRTDWSSSRWSYAFRRMRILSFMPVAYSKILVTTPAPTVFPPSRMAKRSPSSMAMGVMRSIFSCTLSPGMTISVPSGRVHTPVTSVVRR